VLGFGYVVAADNAIRNYIRGPTPGRPHSPFFDRPLTCRLMLMAWAVSRAPRDAPSPRVL